MPRVPCLPAVQRPAQRPSLHSLHRRHRRCGETGVWGIHNRSHSRNHSRSRIATSRMPGRTCKRFRTMASKPLSLYQATPRYHRRRSGPPAGTKHTPTHMYTHPFTRTCTRTGQPHPRGSASTRRLRPAHHPAFIMLRFPHRPRLTLSRRTYTPAGQTTAHRTLLLRPRPPPCRQRCLRRTPYPFRSRFLSLFQSVPQAGMTSTSPRPFHRIISRSSSSVSISNSHPHSSHSRLCRLHPPRPSRLFRLAWIGTPLCTCSRGCTPNLTSAPWQHSLLATTLPHCMPHHCPPLKAQTSNPVGPNPPNPDNGTKPGPVPLAHFAPGLLASRLLHLASWPMAPGT